MQRKLKVVKMLGADALNDDTLEAIHNKNTKQNQFDKDIKALIEMMNSKNPRADLVQDLAAKNKVLKNKYNHIVDTN